MKTLNVLYLLVPCLFFVSLSCGPIEKTADAINRAASVIDRGIEDIQSESAAWQTVIQRVAQDLPEEISETIRNDAQQLATRSVAQTGQEFRCNVDFLSDRAVISLMRLKAKLLDKPLPPLPPPAFCQVVPDGIELKANPERWEKITLHGFDLDHKDADGKLFKILLLDENGNVKELPENRIGRTTHYQITINMGGMANELYQNKIVKLVSSWAGSTENHPEVVVIPWAPKQKTEIVNLTRTSFMPQRAGGGDRDFNTDDDDHMSVDVRGELNISEQFIDSRVFMYAREERHDWTKVEGWSDWARAYTAPQNWKIKEVRPRSNSRHIANITDHGQMTYSRPAGEVIDHFDVWGDRGGDEAGTWTRTEAHWRAIEVTLEERRPTWAQ